MQTKFKDGSVMVVGGCSKDAEMKYVGETGKRVCNADLAVGKRPDGSTIWVRVQAWHETAQVLSQARKGQQVLVIGWLKDREYNGKTYTDLVADFVSVCAPNYAEMEHEAAQTLAAGNKFEDLSDEDGSLPF